MLIDLNKDIKSGLINFLKMKLNEPCFEFNQIIEIYLKNELQ